MPSGTVNDIIADVTKLATDTADALNTLNAKIDGVQTDLQDQINALVPGGAPTGVVTTPTNPTVATGAVQGTLIATLSAPSLTTPTFSIINSSGRYQLSGNQLQVGLVAIDIANGTSDTVTVQALDVDGVTSITNVLTVTVGPPSAPTVFDLNFVTGFYFGGALTDMANVQSGTLTELNNDNSAVTFQPNTVRRTDLGIWSRGTSVEFVGSNSENANAWDISNDAGFTSPTKTDLGVDSNGFHAVRYSSVNTANGYLGQIATEAASAGEVITFKVRAKDPPSGTASGGLVIGIVLGPMGGKSTGLHSLVVFNAGHLTQPTTPTMTVLDSNTQFLSSTANDDGTFDLVFQYTFQADAATWGMGFNTATATSGQWIDIYGCQVAKGSADQPWTNVISTTVTIGADALTYGDPNGVLAGSVGFVCMEVQQLDHATIGTIGYSSNPAGQLLKIGSTTILAPDGPTLFKPMAAAASTPMGISGYRGIVRLAISWDNTANSGAGLWSAFANGGKVASGTGPVGAVGTVAMLPGVTGRLRRLTGGNAKLADADLQKLSQLWNRTFVNPGTALVPGAVRQTFFDDFDVNSLQTIPTPAFPYSSFADMANAYATTADAVHLWKPRAHFHTQDPNGNGINQINHELEEYLDPQVASNYPVMAFENSCLVGTTNATANLTSTQQANVADNPDTAGVKYKYVSWTVTTFGSDKTTGGGGFNQQFGIFNFRVKFPAHKGSWGATWLYCYFDTSELDIEEYYGFDAPDDTEGPTINTTAIHADSFAHNGAVPPCGPHQMGYDLSQDFHDETGVWVLGTYSKYFDGELIVQTPTVGSFDNDPKFLLMNMAVQPHKDAPFDTGDPAPDTASVATMPWLSYVEHVRVFQFGA